jgi:hypothetical protein
LVGLRETHRFNRLWTQAEYIFLANFTVKKGSAWRDRVFAPPVCTAGAGFDPARQHAAAHTMEAAAMRFVTVVEYYRHFLVCCWSSYSIEVLLDVYMNYM